MKFFLTVVIYTLLTNSAIAAPIYIFGAETADTLEANGLSGSVSAVTSPKRTGSYAWQISPTSGGNAYLDFSFTASGSAYARVYQNITTAPVTGRASFGFHNGTRYGCHVDVEPDNSLTLWYKNRSTYQQLGQTTPVSSGFVGIEIHQQNSSGGSCAGSCIVICELSVNGTKVLSTQASNVTSGDYGNVDRVRLGTSDSLASAYTIVFDDLKGDDSAAVGLGRATPLYPSGDGTQVQWNNSCSGSKWQCLDDFLTGPHDSATTSLSETTSGNKTTIIMSDTTLGATDSITSVVSFGVAREVSDNARDWRLNQTDGDNNSDGTPAVNGPTESPGTNFVLSSELIKTTTPGNSSWSISAVNSLTLQLEHRTNVGNIDVTAVLAYVDIREPDPAVRQNLQDWNGDGRLSICAGWDSRTQGTGLGSCSGDGSIQCFTNNDCGTAGVCNGTAKYPTLLASRLTQKINTKTTTVLNCGINGNTSLDANTRVAELMSGVGLATKRYCQVSMPTVCTPDAGCSAIICGSNDCVNEGNSGSDCSLSCALAVGSKICNGGANSGNDCSADSDCTGGACTSLPGCDYILSLVDVNDLHVTSDATCAFPNSARPPCPLIEAVATPNATPTPGSYFMPRVTCNTNTECSTGRCANNMSKACDVDADCPSSTCATAKKINGNTYCMGVCSNDTGRICTGTCSNNFFQSCFIDADCSGGATCNASLMCLGSGTCTSTTKVCTGACNAVPCTTNDRIDGTSSQCGPSNIDVASHRSEVTYQQYGICSGGWCSQCGFSGNTTDTQYPLLRKNLNATRVIAQLEQLKSTVNSNGRRLVFLTTSKIYEAPTLFAWAGTLNDLRAIRDWELRQQNVVDLWTHFWVNDQVSINPRCNNSPSQTCTSDSDCTGFGALCLTFQSSLRPQTNVSFFDEVHWDSLGAQVATDAVADYLTTLYPVCSGDHTTQCGRCSGHCVGGSNNNGYCTTSSACPSGSCATSTGTCAGSDDCPAFQGGEKCVATDSVCSGNGTCSEEAVGNRCSFDLGTACTSNADCTGKGTCRNGGVIPIGSME